MRVRNIFLQGLAVVVLCVGPASADTPPPAPEPADTWECQLADGTTVYTNKERAGCRVMLLRPLSVVPSSETVSVPARRPTVPAAALPQRWVLKPGSGLRV